MTLGSVMLGYASSGAALWTSSLPSSEMSFKVRQEQVPVHAIMPDSHL